MTHVPRYVPAKTNGGWAIVALVFALAAACIVGVTVIHKRTYKHPTDPTPPVRLSSEKAPPAAAAAH
jgi:hypothetical protein